MDIPWNGFASGKLMITGEYMVLCGAAALAVPLYAGQHMLVEPGSRNPYLQWEAYDPSGLWLSVSYSLPGFGIVTSSDTALALKLQRMLKALAELNPDFEISASGQKVVTRLDFIREWGLGSSSSLTSLLATFAGVGQMELHRMISQGSGYDVACAVADGPLIYRIVNDRPEIRPVMFCPPFADKLWLVYLGKKQDSGAEVRRFLQLPKEGFLNETEEISRISESLARVSDFEHFSALLNRHEEIMSKLLNAEAVQKRLFIDFKGVVKSLGAWGGDFVLAAGEGGRDEIVHYFGSKGLHTVIPFTEMVKTGFVAAAAGSPNSTEI